ncbi:MAG: ribonuclease R [Pseudomonadales bacterium]|nr:ribonuclease R [Pseudomonadales bacterium]
MKNHDPFRQREARKYENPIASREFILEVMEGIGAPASFKRLAKELGLEQPTQRDALRSRLGAMVRDGQLVVDRRNVYAIASRMELIAGRVSAHPDGFGFLVPDQKGEEDIFLTVRQMKAVFHGDKALVRVRGRDRRGRSEGEIIEVTERNTDQLVGRLYFEQHLAFVDALNNRINHPILVGAVPEDRREGQIVVVRILEQPSLHNIPRAEIVEVLGDTLTPDMEVEIALRNNDIPVNFPDEVIEAVDRMPNVVSDEDIGAREDLRAIPFVTIDGEDARDFDDAVYCEIKKTGGWRLFVAIADVSHYVKVGSALDQSAFDRGTSVYFPQYVVPMLPEKLSNGLCSLKPDVDRLTVVCEMTISASGRVSGYTFYEATIHSAARLTYTQVARFLSDPGAEAFAEPVAENLANLHSLYRTLATVRDARGALEFDSTELQFSFDAEGNVAGIQPRARNAAHRLIEECMLCANVSAARFIARHKMNGLYRVHEPPDIEKVEYLREFLAMFGVQLEGGEMPTPEDFQAVIDRLRSRKNGHVLQMALLRSMNQAVYQPENKGHFGLNYSEYTHFTSPIRRYPDLLVHRLIKSVIHSTAKSTAVKRKGKPLAEQFYPYEMEEVVMLGDHTSFTERRADQAVYDVLEWIKCNYISGHVGDIHEGVITGVAKFGFFVELADLFVEGLVHVSTLAGDYYQYDQGTQTLKGERSNLAYGLGDIVSVQVARVDIDERKIDFELISHTPLAARRDTRKKKPAKEGRKGREKSSQRAAKPGVKERAPSKRKKSGKKAGKGRKR